MRVVRLTRENPEDAFKCMDLFEDVVNTYKEDGVEVRKLLQSAISGMVRGDYLIYAEVDGQPTGFAFFKKIPSSANDTTFFAVKQWFFCRPGPKAGLCARSMLGLLETLCQADGVEEIIYMMSRERETYKPTIRLLNLCGMGLTGEIYGKRLW